MFIVVFQLQASNACGPWVRCSQGFHKVRDAGLAAGQHQPPAAPATPSGSANSPRRNPLSACLQQAGAIRDRVLETREDHVSLFVVDTGDKHF